MSQADDYYANYAARMRAMEPKQEEVSCYTIGHPRQRHVKVEKAHWERNLWAVRSGDGLCMNAKGEWDWEPRPSERDDAWLLEYRHDLKTALKLAREHLQK